ncbi:4'-phosphopantetheinyl transferase family protein [Modestobacter italicus]|uniref:4'-phosphopantetheinyl transferase family protein n=1 Tax=Modestobacter italicus (strain DSM 44449 / CECT 9708 / BC 501) TaxID=2732864 RepID=UPI001C9588CE|nr:4'-phosphopantetheinyl transferase superfamily protein [Modestobacter italicus]
MSGRSPAGPARDWDVQVRLVTVDASPSDVEAARACLTPAELAHADRGVPPVRTRRVLLRAALRQLAGEVLGLTAAEVPLADPPGRPALIGALAGQDVDLGCSASGALGLVAVARRCRMGVDLERLTTAAADAEDWLTAAEQTALAQLPADRWPAALTRAWTGKEAVLKGVGTGLLVDPRTVDTAAAQAGHGPAGDWHLHPLDVPAGWMASLAVRPSGPTSRAAEGTVTLR